MTLAAQNILSRYNDVTAQVRAKGGVACGSLATQPVAGFTRGEIMLGSHVDDNPESVDVVHVLSTRQVNGEEHLVMEAFVSYTERGMMDRLLKKPGTPCLHHYVTEYVRGSSGSQLVDAVLATCDLNTGELRDLSRGNEAIEKVWRLEDQTGKRITS